MSAPAVRGQRRQGTAWTSAAVRPWLPSLLLATALAALAWPLVFERGPLVFTDYPAWAASTRMLDREIWPQTHDLWGIPFPRYNAGEILGQPYSLSLALPLLLAKLVGVEWALKLTVPLTYLTLGLGVYVFLRRRTGHLPAALAGYLCVIESLYHINGGMWYNALSIGLAFWFLVALDGWLQAGRRSGWVAAVLLLALAFLAHPLGSILALLGWVAAPFDPSVRRALRGLRLFYFLAIPVLGLGLASPQAAAILATNVDAVGQAGRPRADPFYQLPDPIVTGVVLLAAWGVVKMVLRRRWAFLGRVLLPLTASFLLYQNVAARVPVEFPLQGGLIAFAERFGLVVASLLLVVAAVGLAYLHEQAVAGRRPSRAIAGAAVVVAVAATVVIGADRMLVHQPRTLVGETGIPDHASFTELRDWLAAAAPAQEGRIYVEDTWESPEFAVPPGSAVNRWVLARAGGQPSHKTHALALLAFHAPVAQINGFPRYNNPFSVRYCSDAGRLFNISVADLTPGDVERGMSLLACSHLVVFSAEARDQLSRCDFLTPAATFGRYHVFRRTDESAQLAWRRGDAPHPLPTRAMSVHDYMVDLGPAVAGDGGAAGDVFVSLQYHPNWQARIDGVSVPVHEHEALLRVPVPSGGGTLRLTYDSRSEPAFALAGLAAALVPVLGFLLPGSRRQRARRST
ncbi:MAG: hypothetical protein R6X25_09345 [Candidatus Krumholzibacteriia bacterium]